MMSYTTRALPRHRTVRGSATPTDALGAEASLIQDTIGGDHEAFNTLIAPYVSEVFRHIRHRSNSTADAQDIAQATWFTVWQKLETYDPNLGPFVAFVLYRAHLMRLQYYAAMRRQPPTVSLSDELSDTALERVMHFRFDDATLAVWHIYHLPVRPCDGAQSISQRCQ